MKRKCASLCMTLILLLSSLVAAKDLTQQYENNNSQFEFHGRLSVYNGNPMFRIWIIGTKRLLGVRGGDQEEADMPKELEQLFTKPFVQIYGDFTVTPIDTYKKGTMQTVRIDAVKNLVIYRDEAFVSRMATL